MSDHRKGPRRRHSDEFKMKVVKACGGPDVSVAAVALSFGVNANLVRQWLRGRGFKREGVASPVPAAAASPQRFVPLALAAASPSKPQAGLVGADIRVEVHRGGLQVNVSWPQAAAADCAAWLRELLR